jgi:hypothetical protein
MMLTRLLSALICAATVLVTAQFLPNVAQAHGGHDHANSVAFTSPDHVTNSGLHGDDAAGSAKTKRAAEHTEVAPSDTIPATPSGTCTGSCCGNGVACCGAAFLFPPAVTLPDIGIARQPVITASLGPTGIDPDALRKPPKSLA